MRTKRIIYVSIIASIFAILLYAYHTMVSGWNWSPPETSLDLTEKEESWVQLAQNKYDCRIDYIGLDDAFREDSIIYITIHCPKESPIQMNLCTDPYKLTQDLGESFRVASTHKRQQKYLEFMYQYVRYKAPDTLLKYYRAKRYMYDTRSKLAIEKTDN